MEVILQEDIPTLGRAGEIVKVRDGYGRNYLLPTHKAVLADLKNKNQLEHHKKVIAAKQAKLVKSAQELKAKLDQHSMTFAKEAGEEDKLFGSVTSMEIAENLKAAGYSIDKRMIQLEDTIKTLGEFKVPIRLQHEVIAAVKVVVTKK